MDNNAKKSKLSLTALILMIFTSVFGFTNMPRSFYLLGYSAIIWYIAAAIFFFIPYAFMVAEYGAAFKNEKGGIFSWMERSVNTEFAFIGTFMWYASYVIWLVSSASSLWIMLSTTLYGHDTTATWHLSLGFLHLNSVQVIGILGILWMAFVTATASRGLDKIEKFTSVGGTAVALLNIVLIAGALFVLISHGGHFAEPITAQSMLHSPNHDYQSMMGVLSFLVFALFSYGGIEVVGGLVDDTENPLHNFPRGIMISSLVITVGYAIGIFLCGAFTNWQEVLSSDKVNMANIAYVVMQNLGYEIGNSLGLAQDSAITMGMWLARFVGLSMFLAIVGAFFASTYAPLKQLIEGLPKDFWPGRLGELNEDGVPQYAMNVQSVIVVFLIALISFDGSSASAFYDKLILMSNVATTIPYAFITIAYIYFKRRKDIEKPFEIVKSTSFAVVISIAVTVTIIFANIFTIINPALTGDTSDTFWMIIGPIFFTLIAILLYKRYERKCAAGEIVDLDKE